MAGASTLQAIAKAKLKKDPVISDLANNYSAKLKAAQQNPNAAERNKSLNELGADIGAKQANGRSSFGGSIKGSNYQIPNGDELYSAISSVINPKNVPTRSRYAFMSKAANEKLQSAKKNFMDKYQTKTPTGAATSVTPPSITAALQTQTTSTQAAPAQQKTSTDGADGKLTLARKRLLGA